MANISPYLLVAWVPLVLLVIPGFQKHKGMLVAVLLGLLFLPEVGSGGAEEGGGHVIVLSPFRFTKALTISYALLLAVLVYDLPLLGSFRPHWVDLPMALWCLCPLPSALTNQPPPDGSSAIYDGFSQAFHQTMTWGVPYLIGRLYFVDRRALRDLALGCVVAGVVYAPLCLVEVRMSPQLHNMVYGFSQHMFAQTIRFDGYRPMVFFQHGLALAFWMVGSLLFATGLLCSRGEDWAKSYLGWGLLVLLPTTILLKSMGALVLGMAGLAVLCLVRVWPSRVWLLLLLAVSPLYVSLRCSGVWTGRELVQLMRETVGEGRAQSLEYRLDNEDRLLERALEQPFFGWGGWGRMRVLNERGKDISVPDGMWIIALGDRGFVGLLALGGVLLVPALRWTFRFPPSTWSDVLVVPLTLCALIVVLWSIDSVLNAMFNHLYVLMAGGLAGVEQWTESKRPKVAVPAMAGLLAGTTTWSTPHTSG